MVFLQQDAGTLPTGGLVTNILKRIALYFVFILAALAVIAAMPQKPRKPVPTPFCDKYLAPHLVPDTSERAKSRTSRTSNEIRIP